MCQGWRSQGSIALQAAPAGAGRVMLAVRHGSEAEPGASPRFKIALPGGQISQSLVSNLRSPRSAAARDGSPRHGSRREGRRIGQLRSRGAFRLVCGEGALGTELNSVLAQLQSRGVALEDGRGGAEVVVEWDLVRSHLEGINGWRGPVPGFPRLDLPRHGSVGGPLERRLCLPEGAVLQPSDLGSGGSHAPEGCSQGSVSGREALVASGEAEASRVEGASLKPGECTGSLCDDGDVESLPDCAVLRDNLCPERPHCVATDVGSVGCSAQLCEGEEAGGMGEDWEWRAGAQQPGLVVGERCSAQQPEGTEQVGMSGEGVSEAGVEAADSTETFQARAGRVQSMVDELLGTTSSALDDNSRSMVGVASLKSKFQSLLDDIHAMQREVGCRGRQSSTQGSPLLQEAGCKKSEESPMPLVAKACDGVVDQKTCLAGSPSAGRKDDIEEPCLCEASLEGSESDALESGSDSGLSEDWDCDGLESACCSEDDGQDDDMWSNWSYAADEADLALSGVSGHFSMGLDLGSAQRGEAWGGGLDRPAGAGYDDEDSIMALTSVSSEESLTCLVEGDEGLVSLCRDDGQSLSGALSDGQGTCSPDLEDCARSLSPVSVGEEEAEGGVGGAEENIAVGDRDGEDNGMPADILGAQDSPFGGSAACQSDCLLGGAVFGGLGERWCCEVEDVGRGKGNREGAEEADMAAAEGAAACREAESLAKPTSSAIQVTSLVRKVACLPREIFSITDEGVENIGRIGTFNHFEGVGCWQDGGRTVGLRAGSGSETCVEVIERRGVECCLEGSVHGIRCDKKGLALTRATYNGCSLGSLGRCADGGTCPMLEGGDSLIRWEVIAPQEQQPQQWSRIIITDPKLFFEACWHVVQSGFADDVGAMALAVSHPPIDNVDGHEGCMALADQCACSWPSVANMVSGDLDSPPAPEAMATACLPMQKSALALCSSQSGAEVSRLSPGEPGCRECCLLGSPTDGRILLSSSLDVKWFSDALQRMVRSGSPLAMLDILGGEEELECDGIEEMGTIAASGIDPRLWPNDCTDLRAAVRCLGSSRLAAWRLGKCRVMTQCTVGGMEARYDGGGLVALQIALERPRRGGGARLQHGMCIHTSGDAEACAWCSPAWNQKAGATALKCGSAQGFWRLWMQMWLKKTRHACQFFMHLWTLRAERGRVG